jgi:very-short-patch-repair endonuclease
MGILRIFYCHQHNLIVEVDGGVHKLQKEYDAEREAYLVALGFRVIRFTNEAVNKNLRSVLQKIVETCKK